MHACTRRDFLGAALTGAASLPVLQVLGCTDAERRPPGVLAEPADGYPTVRIEGSYGDIGHALGAEMRARHEGYLAVARDFPTCLTYLEGPGRRRLETMLALTRDRFPHLIEELEGMADGVGRPPMELFAHVCRSEIGVLARTPGCSTLGLRTQDAVLLVQNEDGNDLNVGRMFLAEVRPPSGVAFKAFVYPGLPPCNGPGFNELGIVHATNYIQPADTADGIPRYFLGRAILEARSLDEALELATTAPRAFAWHHNLASLREGRLLSVEVTADRHSVLEVEGPHLHTNHLVHPGMAGLDEPYESSLTRWRVLSEAIAADGPPSTGDEMLVLLSSHEGRPYSPCRHPQGDVHGATLGTLVASGPPSATVLVHGNPCRGVARPW